MSNGLEMVVHTHCTRFSWISVTCDFPLFARINNSFVNIEDNVAARMCKMQMVHLLCMTVAVNPARPRGKTHSGNKRFDILVQFSFHAALTKGLRH